MLSRIGARKCTIGSFCNTILLGRIRTAHDLPDAPSAAELLELSATVLSTVIANQRLYSSRLMLGLDADRAKYVENNRR